MHTTILFNVVREKISCIALDLLQNDNLITFRGEQSDAEAANEHKNTDEEAGSSRLGRALQI